MPPDVEYAVFVEDTLRYRAYLDGLIEKHPELFPGEIFKDIAFTDLSNQTNCTYAPAGFSSKVIAKLTNCGLIQSCPT